MKHKYLGHEPCDNIGCPICEDGADIFCTVCESGGMISTSDCPGRRITPNEWDLIITGAIDFKNGEWISLIQTKGK